MKMMIAALALALPAIAHAGTAPAPTPAPKMECCCKDMAKPMDCCKEKGRSEAGEGEHKAHDMGGHR